MVSLKGSHGSHGSHGFFFVASNGDSHLVSQWKNSEGVGKFVRFERFVFKNQPARELLIVFTEHELHEQVA